MRPVYAALALTLLTACGAEAPSSNTSSTSKGCTSRAYPEIGGPISMVNDKGEAVTEADFKGTPSAVFFGFTYCPDVCPMTLVKLKQAYDLLPEGMEAPQTLLITVDPERDTPEALATYLESNAFPENAVGLTGSDEQIAAAAKAFAAGYTRIEQPESVAGYTMDHSALVYLMDEDWQLQTFFDPTETPDMIASCLAQKLG